MSTQPVPVPPSPSSERARRLLERAREESLVAREQRRFARQMHAHAALLLRNARDSADMRRDRPSAG
jgi:hypothetical protein